MLPAEEFERREATANPHSERMLGFLHELHTQSDPRSTGDERIAAFAVAANRSIYDDEHFRNVIDGLLSDRSELAPSYAVNLVLRALQKQLSRRPDSTGYPDAYTTPEPWRDSIAWVSEPENTAEHYDFVADLTYRQVQSNVAERYKSIALIAQLMSPRLSEHPTILDVGCSQNQGLKKLALSGQIPFAPFHSMSEQPPERTRLETEILNKLLVRAVPLGPSIGIDAIHADDANNKEWARSCSFYPSELLNDHRREEYDLLEMAHPPQVGFYQADFADLDIDDLLRQSPSERFDIVSFSTVLYQVSEEQRATMIANARKLLKPSGLIVIQDFVTLDEQDHTKLVFHPNWFEYSYIYTTVVIDPLDTTGRAHEVFRWENGRCNKMKAGRDLGRVMLYVD
jgi:hypothetical protein